MKKSFRKIMELMENGKELRETIPQNAISTLRIKEGWQRSC